jgi:ArsR family transcriptional regulator, cadmium/lead-responsive transcriptional repressor
METVTLTHTSALARLGYALSDETRARILLALREAPACPSDPHLAPALDDLLRLVVAVDPGCCAADGCTCS